MEAPCPICDTVSPAGTLYCPGCGLPASLAPEARRALVTSPLSNLLRGEGAERPPESPAPPVPIRKSDRPPDAHAETMERVARVIEEHLKMLHLLGEDAPDVTTQVAQAALTQASGNPTPALELLRDAEGRLSQRVLEVGDRRISEVEARDLNLLSLGVGADVAADTLRIRSEIKEGRIEAAVHHLEDVTQRLGRVEADWRGLLGLVRQVDTLFEGARKLGIELGDVEQELSRVRTTIRTSPVNPEGIDRAAQMAARAMMFVNETLPPRIREELETHQAHLSVYPGDHPPSRQARALHAEVSRHLRNGRLPEATLRLKELREAIRDLGAVRVAPEPTAAGTEEETGPAVPVIAATPPSPGSPSILRIPASPSSLSEPPALTVASTPPFSSIHRIGGVLNEPVRNPSSIPPLASVAPASPPGTGIAPIPPFRPPATPPGLREAFPQPSARSTFTPTTRPAGAAHAAPAPSAESPAQTTGISPKIVAELLIQARSLAVRVRALPPDGALAAEAAKGIRSATESLRSQKVEEAKRTITGLMNMLDAAEGQSGVR